MERVNRILDLIARDSRFEACTMAEAAGRADELTGRGDGLPSNPPWMTAARVLQSARDVVPTQRFLSGH